MNVKSTQGILMVVILFVLMITNSIAGNLLHGPSKTEVNLPSVKGSLIVYREHGESSKKTATIFLNGNKVLGTLLPNEYLQTELCADKIKLRVATRGELVSSGRSKTIHITEGKIVYIKIVEAKNKTLVPVIVDENEGQKSIKHVTRKSNIINRFVPKMVFETDSLFAFNSSKLLPSSHSMMKKLAHNIQTCVDQVKSIKVIGHTDRLGNAAVNMKLSKERAKSVAEYLSKQGVKISIITEGRGSKEPVTTKCRGKFSPKLIQCLQPDRRVEIELSNNTVK